MALVWERDIKHGPLGPISTHSRCPALLYHKRNQKTQETQSKASKESAKAPLPSWRGSGSHRKRSSSSPQAIAASDLQSLLVSPVRTYDHTM